MRVLHVIPAVAARYGGPSVVVASVARAQLDAGHDVMIATTDADGDHRLDVVDGQATVWDGVPAILFHRTASEAFKWSPALARWLGARARDFDIVDVHAVFSHSSIAAGRACRQSRVPYVVRPHGALDPWSLGRKSLQKRVFLAAGGRRMLKGASRMQYTTPAEQRLAEGALPWLPAGVVVPLGVDEECFAPVDEGRTAQQPFVLVMSRLEQKKGLELLIDAFHRVTGAGALNHWRLVLAGDGRSDYVAALRARAAAGAASRRIEFAGWVSGPRKRALLQGATLFASPSEQENFGLSLVEAMAAGVPAVVSPGVNLADEITAAGAGWVVGRDPAMFSVRLESILADTEALLERGRAARTLAGRYRWNRSADLLAEVYHAAIAAETARSYV